MESKRWKRMKRNEKKGREMERDKKILVYYRKRWKIRMLRRWCVRGSGSGGRGEGSN